MHPEICLFPACLPAKKNEESTMRFDGLLIRAAGLGLVLAVLASCVREPEKPKDFEPGRVLLPRIDQSDPFCHTAVY